MKTILRIYRNNRPDHFYKYTIFQDNKVIGETNSKEEIKIMLDLNGMKMYRFLGCGSNGDEINRYYMCFYN